MKTYNIYSAQTTNLTEKTAKIEWIVPAHELKGSPREVELRIIIDNEIVFSCIDADAETFSDEISLVLQQTNLFTELEDIPF